MNETAQRSPTTRFVVIAFPIVLDPRVPLSRHYYIHSNSGINGAKYHQFDICEQTQLSTTHHAKY